MSWNRFVPSLTFDEDDLTLTASTYQTDISCFIEGVESTAIDNISALEKTYTVNILESTPIIEALNNVLNYPVSYTIGSGPMTITPSCSYAGNAGGNTIAYSLTTPQTWQTWTPSTPSLIIESDDENLTAISPFTTTISCLPEGPAAS